MSPKDPPPLTGSPPAEVEIDGDLVRNLLRDQHPDLAHLPLQLIDVGWDNAMFRLGKQFLVRLPRRQLAASLIENEQRWLPVIAARLPIPVPAPVRVGQPGAAIHGSGASCPGSRATPPIAPSHMPIRRCA